MALCGANLNFDAITESAGDLKTSLKSKLGGAGTFTSASDLTSLVDGKVSALTAQVSGLLPELPSVPPLSFQSELTSLANFDRTTVTGLLDYQSKLSSITDNFGSALSGGGFDLDDLVSKAAPTISSLSGSASGALSQITDAASGASSLVTDAIAEASSVASSLSSGATDALSSASGLLSGGATDALSSASGLLSGGLPSVPSFDVCKDCPNFELQAGATEAIQSAQETVLSNAKGIAEEFAEVSTNVDFNAQFSEMTTKANKILADPDVQSQIAADVSSAQTQISADIESAIDLIPSELSVKMPKVSPFKGKII